MPRPKGSENRSTLEREAAAKVDQSCCRPIPGEGRAVWRPPTTVTAWVDDRPMKRVLPNNASHKSVVRSKGHRKLLRFQPEILLTATMPISRTFVSFRTDGVRTTHHVYLLTQRVTC
eukprot:COSAG02_NODE_9688_length_2140_cov_27.903969_2_plen_117_part_00